MKNIEQKKNMLWWREQYLKAMEIALKTYATSKDETYLNFAKYFGKESEKLKIKINNL